MIWHISGVWLYNLLVCFISLLIINPNPINPILKLTLNRKEKKKRGKLTIIILP